MFTPGDEPTEEPMTNDAAGGTPHDDDLTLAKRVVLSREKTITIPGVRQLGDVFHFSPTEEEQFPSLCDLVERYTRLSDHKRPLCLAIFGPPGSGKSFMAEQIGKVVTERQKAEVKATANAKLEAIQKASAGAPGAHAEVGGKKDEEEEERRVREEEERALKALPLEEKPRTLNLTQVPDAVALARALATIADAQKAALDETGRKTVPIVFFDEFDASRAGAPYGWLGWFLAPMHDGEFWHEGALVKLRRAIYVFAGGTADTTDEFAARRSDPVFRAAKGPDFVSRLRGHLDVQGPNAERPLLRRALILRKELRDRAKALDVSSITVDDSILTSLLTAGRYVHGARSVGAIVDMSSIGKDARFAEAQLPERHLAAQHVDRGRLAATAIGGAIALSGFNQEPNSERDVTLVWKSIAERLWEQGATLAYGGSKGGELTGVLASNATWQPRALYEASDNYRLWIFRSSVPEGAGKLEGVGLLEEDGTTTEEDQRFQDVRTADRDWLKGVLTRFRRRLKLSELCVARLAIAGKTTAYDSRFPGIAEEVMLTLALRKPVYVAGAFSGAAEQVGALLGLSRPWTGRALESSRAHYREHPEELLVELADKVRPPPLTSLPVTLDDLIAFLRAHALGDDLWPDNGLTPDENRELFRCDRADRIAELVVKGLTRRFPIR
jgi:SLOG-like protein